MIAWPPLIPAALDDAGLSLYEFRLFCRIARRGECWESVPKMAADCRIHVDTVWKALRSLEKRRMIERERRTGLTSIFRITDPKRWKQPDGKQGAAQPENRGRVTKRKRGGGHPPENRGHKGSPSKEVEAEENEDIPEPPRY